MAAGWLLAQYSCPVNQSMEMLFTSPASAETQQFKASHPCSRPEGNTQAAHSSTGKARLLPTCIERLRALSWDVNAELAVFCQPVVSFSEQVIHQGTEFSVGGEQWPVGSSPYIQKGQILPHGHQELCCIVCQGEGDVIQSVGMQLHGSTAQPLRWPRLLSSPYLPLHRWCHAAVYNPEGKHS